MKGEKEMHVTRITDEVFRANFVLVCGDREELDEFSSKEFPGYAKLPRGAQAYTQVLVGRDSGLTTFFVQLVPSESLSSSASNLSHECLHVAIMSLKDAGVKWDDPELLCYYSEFFFRKAYRDFLTHMLEVSEEEEEECKTKE